MKRKMQSSLLACFVALGMFAVAARAQEKPLTKDQVTTLVRNQMGDDSGAQIVQKRGIDFTPTDDFLSSLKKSGASNAFLQALRSARQPKSSPSQDPNKKTLSQVQILALLAGDVPSSRVAMLVSERGIDFTPTDDYLKTLQGVGAESDLVDALRAAKPPQTTLSTASGQTTVADAANTAQQADVQQHMARGLSFRRQGQYAEAEQEYRAATQADPGNADLWVSLAYAQYHQGKFDESVAAADQALRLNPQNDRAHNAIGMAMGSKGDYEKAAAEFREAIRLNPNNDAAHGNLGISLSRQGDLDGALAEDREALRINPKNDHAHDNLGVALRKKGDLPGAILQFREAIRLNPNNDLAHANLGSALNQDNKPRLALEQYRIACELKPNNQAYRRAYDTLQRRINSSQ